MDPCSGVTTPAGSRRLRTRDACYAYSSPSETSPCGERFCALIAGHEFRREGLSRDYDARRPSTIRGIGPAPGRRRKYDSQKRKHDLLFWRSDDKMMGSHSIARLRIVPRTVAAGEDASVGSTAVFRSEFSPPSPNLHDCLLNELGALCRKFGVGVGVGAERRIRVCRP